MNQTLVAIIVALLCTRCAGAAVPAAVPPVAGPSNASAEATDPDAIVPLLDAARLLLATGLSVREEHIPGTRGSRTLLSISASNGAGYHGVAAELARHLGPPTCSGATYAQWDGRLRIHAYRHSTYLTAIIVELPPDPDAACGSPALPSA